jgi:hypothetical protein
LVRLKGEFTMNQTRVLFIPVLLLLFEFTLPVFSLESSIEVPFSNRIIFSQTPEIGEKWHGGIRMNDFIAWDIYWNFNDWFTTDFFRAGFNKMRFPGENGDTVTLTDYLYLLSLKSRPLSFTLLNNPYAIGGGITGYSSAFEFVNQINEGITEKTSGELAIFVAQSWFLKSRHYLNLASTVSFMKNSGMDKAVASIYLIPGYRYFIDNGRRWSFDAEYYFMNPVELPFKTLQYAFDPDQNEFYNPEQLFVSFTFWGFSYSREHLRLELHLGHHISFTGPIIPMAGIGWDF